MYSNPSSLRFKWNTEGRNEQTPHRALLLLQSVNIYSLARLFSPPPSLRLFSSPSCLLLQCIIKKVRINEAVWSKVQGVPRHYLFY